MHDRSTTVSSINLDPAPCLQLSLEDFPHLPYDQYTVTDMTQYKLQGVLLCNPPIHSRNPPHNKKSRNTHRLEKLLTLQPRPPEIPMLFPRRLGAPDPRRVGAPSRRPRTVTSRAAPTALRISPLGTGRERVLRLRGRGGLSRGRAHGFGRGERGGRIRHDVRRRRRGSPRAVHHFRRSLPLALLAAWAWLGEGVGD